MNKSKQSSELFVTEPDFIAGTLRQQQIGFSVAPPTRRVSFLQERELSLTEQGLTSGQLLGRDLGELTEQAFLALTRAELPENTTVALVGDVVYKGMQVVQARLDGQAIDVTASDIDVLIFGQDAETVFARAGVRENRTTVQIGPYTFTGAHSGDVHLHVTAQKLRNGEELAGLIDVPQHRLVALVSPKDLSPRWSFKGVGGHGWLSGEVTTTTSTRVLRADKRGLFVPDQLLRLAQSLPAGAVIHLGPDGYLSEAEHEALQAKRSECAEEVGQWQINAEALQASAEQEQDAAALSGVMDDEDEVDEAEVEVSLVE